MHPRLRSLSIAGREALAFARQAWLLPHDTTAPVVPDKVLERDHVVVFLHGLFASAGVLRPLRAAVTGGGKGPRNGAAEEGARVHAAAFSYAPGPGIEELASRLAEITAALPLS